MITHGSLLQRSKYALSLAGEYLGMKDQEEIKKSPDFIEVKKDEDSREISIDQIRELITNVQMLPSKKGGCKVVVIEELNHASIPAQNSLLKTLEEPPNNALLIVTCPHKKTVLPTVTSRCRNIKVKYESSEEQTIESSPNILDTDLVNLLEWVEDNNKNMESKDWARNIITGWMRLMENQLRLSNNNAKKSLKIQNIIEQLYALNRVIDSNASTRLQIESFFIKISRL